MTPSRPHRPRRVAAVLVVAGALVAGSALFVGGALAARSTNLQHGGDRHTVPSSGVGVEVAPPTTAATTTTTAPTTTTTLAPAGADGSLELGEAGPEVAALQERLSALGYWLGQPDGTYGQLTRQAVMAFQKVEGLHRDGVAGPATGAALDAAVRPGPMEPSGTHIEIDLGRQVLLAVRDGQTELVLNTSTGSGEAYASPGGGSAVATTPTGAFRIQREIDGLRQAPLGTLYRPKYFDGGIAIHGAGSVPAHPASHGCARVTNSAMDLLWSSGLATVGTTVLVH